MKNSMIVGSRPECDHVIAVPSVSGRHCQATREGDVVYLHDLESRNGTYVNGQRLVGSNRVAITPADVVHLASHQLDLAPLFAGLSVVAAAAVVERILEFKGDSAVLGRGAESDIVVALPTVSTRHARLTRVGSDVVVEDIGSANGTFIDGVRVTQPTVLPRQGVLGLGSSQFRLTPDSWRGPQPEIALSPKVTVVEPPRIDLIERPSIGAVRSSTIDQGKTAAIAVGLLAAPLLPALAVRLAGAGGGIGPLILALAAPALGVLDVLVLRLAGVRGPRVAGFAAGAAVAQGLALAIVGAPAAIPAALLVLTLAVSAGVAAAALTSALVPGQTGAQLTATAVLIATMGLAGGLVPALPDLPAMLKPLTAVSPTRWAFEGLVLAGSDSSPVAERVFPAASERMGLTADCVALALMAAGLGGLLAAMRALPGLAGGGTQPAFPTG